MEEHLSWFDNVLNRAGPWAAGTTVVVLLLIVLWRYAGKEALGMLTNMIADLRSANEFSKEAASANRDAARESRLLSKASNEMTHRLINRLERLEREPPKAD